MEEGSEAQSHAHVAEAAQQPPPVLMDQVEDREAAAKPMEDEEATIAEASKAADPMEDDEAACDVIGVPEPMRMMMHPRPPRLRSRLLPLPTPPSR